MTPDAIEGYAIGYYYGRSIGNDEPGLIELRLRFSQHQNYEEFKYGFRYGYDRGVTDYVDMDEEHDCSDADRPCDDCLTSNLPVFDGE
jgi:hypothetical protein